MRVTQPQKPVGSRYKGTIMDLTELQAELAALREENERHLRDLKHGEQMYIAMRDRCARTEAQLAQMRKPVGTAEWDRAKGQLAYRTGMTFLHDFEIATALVASRAAEPVQKEEP